MKKKILKTAASITKATWLDELHEVRRKKKWENSKYNTEQRNTRGSPRSRRTIQKKNIRSARHDVTDGQTGS